LIPLTGKFRSVLGVRFFEAKDGLWLRSQDLKVAPAPSELPWFA
jgi:hypothetical protein